MTDIQTILNILQRGGVVPVVRLPSLEQAVPLVRALLAGGITAIEPTMTSPGALDVLPRLLAEIPAFGAGEAVLGMGSVTNPEQAAAAIDAGAHFIVAPVLDLPTVAYCVARGVPVMPGALTPSEIQTAWTAGASVVKVFPARVFGPGYFKDVLAPLPHLRLMPTGGVDLSNVADFVKAGAVAVGVGSALVDKKLIDAGDWAEITRRSAEYVQTVHKARGK
ncbi:MAG: bifunctional 4-hydroxy-2-oxoglutarate aldolase/2-dehydro-3-deoxy-phosphogluconate aldolase [Chloroflexi bacterium]|nr:MAG: bifunctional 4-hydroxy-2-oxoglutarate aldolase/2-dehydro-3-deoxy-phosphogluconate aldolase [Chloroflexota bacterium]